MDENGGLSGRRILFVDDEEITREFAERVLQDCGCAVFTAEDGKSASQVYQAEGGRFDLVITDWRMPEVDGRELIIDLRKQGFAGAILLTSAHINDKNTQHFHTAFHVQHLLPKPFTAEQLTEMVRCVFAEQA